MDQKIPLKWTQNIIDYVTASKFGFAISQILGSLSILNYLSSFITHLMTRKNVDVYSVTNINYMMLLPLKCGYNKIVDVGHKVHTITADTDI